MIQLAICEFPPFTYDSCKFSPWGSKLRKEPVKGGKKFIFNITSDNFMCVGGGKKILKIFSCLVRLELWG